MAYHKKKIITKLDWGKKVDLEAMEKHNNDLNNIQNNDQNGKYDQKEQSRVQ